MDDITVTLTKEEVRYLENMLMLDKLYNISKLIQDEWSEEYAGYIETDEKVFDKLRKAWK